MSTGTAFMPRPRTQASATARPARAPRERTAAPEPAGTPRYLGGSARAPRASAFLQRQPETPVAELDEEAQVEGRLQRMPQGDDGDEVQAKLEINQPGDPFEAEADRVADAALRGTPPAATPASRAAPAGMQRKCAACARAEAEGRTAPCPACENEPEMVQRAGAGAAPGPSRAAAAAVRSPGTGTPLPAAVRARVEPVLGRDLSGVRVHGDARANAAARSIGARAFTHGQDIWLGPGQSAGDVALMAHEATHTVQQAEGGFAGPVPAIQRDEDACATRFRRTTSFSGYVDLVRAAETRLSAAGYTDAGDRIHVLRGIYYGTEWSADYAKEKSAVRNAGFQVYTASTTPDDPRGVLDCGLFEALRGSQDLVDGGRRVDVGHLLIGLDARRSWTARSVSIPTQGGTGLDISTWLGDLGGGAGMLAYQRVTAPNTSAMTKFRGTDFGGPINLEGDVAGFVVARDTSTTPSGPVGLTMAPSSTIADALAAYLLPTGSGATGSEWNNRCKTFLQMQGASFDASGALSNRADLIDRFRDQIADFACWYLVNRLRQTNRLGISTLRTASLHVEGASEEIATIFVDALDRCQSTPGSNLAATGSGPTPTAIGSGSPTACSLAIRALEAAERADALRRRAEELAEEYWPF